MRARIGYWLLLLALTQPFVAAQKKPEYTFGVTVVDSAGLQGRIYYLEPNTQRLPDFRRMKSVGTIYTRALNIWPQHFESGFPDITGRFEWFAITYSGRLWIEKQGPYKFSLLSDDGARLKLNGQVVIDLDGQHESRVSSAGATLTRGGYNIEVDYFQGPRFTVALVLAIAPPGEPWRILNTGDFMAPTDPLDWVSGHLADIQPQTP
jgi:hypothetical protein